ncbi:collagen alpha-1(I) chain-like isoform X2 [Mauremys reevesii]|uniref:collagen alpha-1(I) chain-like isoform X2 n=1 Tax=Mauremys reevesii TaxID=260615 RepID=UPI00193FE934|nr:collagen alpha-1(I) chain-like isoform X2 [Mauremys reevesii]
MCRSRQNTKHQRVDPCLPFLITQSILRDLNPGPFGVPAPSWDSTSPARGSCCCAARVAPRGPTAAAPRWGQPGACGSVRTARSPQGRHPTSSPPRGDQQPARLRVEPGAAPVRLPEAGGQDPPHSPREPDFPVPGSEDPSLPRSLALLPTAPVLGRAVDPRGFPAAAPLRNIPALPEQGAAPQNTQNGYKLLFCRKTSSPGISWLLGIVGLCRP